MGVTLVPAGHRGSAVELVEVIAGLERAGTNAVWFAGRPERADETGVAAAALATTGLRLGVPMLAGDNVFWAARRIGSLCWAAGGRGLDVLFVVHRPADEPTVLANLALLRQLWTDPEFAAWAQVRPAGAAAAVLLGPHADAMAAPLGLPWIVPEPTGPPRTGGLDDQVSWLPPTASA